VVYSNSNLGEMSRVATRVMLHVSKQMLSESKLGVVCFVSKGSPSQLEHTEVDQEFEIFGYHKICEKPFSAYALNPGVDATLLEAFKDGIPDYQPSGRSTKVTAADVVPVGRDDAPLDLPLARWYHGFEPPYKDR